LFLLEKRDEPRIKLKIVRLDGGLTMLEGTKVGSGIAKSRKGVVARYMMPF